MNITDKDTIATINEIRGILIDTISNHDLMIKCYDTMLNCISDASSISDIVNTIIAAQDLPRATRVRLRDYVGIVNTASEREDIEYIPRKAARNLVLMTATDELAIGAMAENIRSQIRRDYGIFARFIIKVLDANGTIKRMVYDTMLTAMRYAADEINISAYLSAHARYIEDDNGSHS